MAKLPKAVRLNAILSAAMQEFLEKGYYQTSIDSIAAKAGVTKGGLYHHFKSKDEVLLAANQKFGEPVGEMLQHMQTYERADEALNYFIRTYLSYWASHRRELYFFSLSMTKTLELTQLSDLHAQSSDVIIGLLAATYEKGIQQGFFIEHDARSSALALLSALNGSLAYITMDPRLTVAEVAGRFTFCFIHLLQPK